MILVINIVQLIDPIHVHYLLLVVLMSKEDLVLVQEISGLLLDHLIGVLLLLEIEVMISIIIFLKS